MKEKSKIRNIKAMARKPLYEEKLIPFTVKLRRDQLKYIKEQENASEWLRNAIDEKISSESDITKATSKHAIIKIIDVKQRELNKIRSDPFYQEAPQQLEYMKHSLKSIAKAETVKVGIRKDWEKGALYVNGGFQDCWRKSSIPIAFMVENKLDFTEPIPKDKIPLLIEQLKRYYTYTKNKLEAMQERKQELETQIRELLEKLGKT